MRGVYRIFTLNSLLKLWLQDGTGLQKWSCSTITTMNLSTFGDLAARWQSLSNAPKTTLGRHTSTTKRESCSRVKAAIHCLRGMMWNNATILTIYKKKTRLGKSVGKSKLRIETWLSFQMMNRWTRWRTSYTLKKYRNRSKIASIVQILICRESLSKCWSSTHSTDQLSKSF